MNPIARGTIHLVIGGIRSGKSAWAETRAATLASDGAGRPVIYIAAGVAAATADAAMQQRIHRHQERRPAHWQTLEAPLNPVGALQAASLDPATRPVLLLDSLDGWASNLLLEHERTPPAELEARVTGAALRFVILAIQLKADALIVSSEVGQSPVAMTPLGRQFQDLLGTLNQAVAAVADEVTLLVAGIPMPVKRPGGAA